MPTEDALIDEEDVIRAFESRLSTAPALDVVLLDNTLDTPANNPTMKAHKGVAIAPAGLANLGMTRNRTVARVRLSLVITLTYQLREDARTARDEAITLARLVRQRVTERTWLPGGVADQVRFISSAMGYHPQSRAWYTVAQTFVVDFDTTLGDGV